MEMVTHINNQVKVEITCNDCDYVLYSGSGNNLMELEIHSQNETRSYKGYNHNEHLCRNCKKARERSYDSYIMQRDMFNLK